MAEPLLDVRDLTVTLAGRVVVDGVDLTVQSGELVGLLGPNGAGKTTLLRAVLGVIPVAAGSVRVAGRDRDTPAAGTDSRNGGTTAANRRDGAISAIGYVPQRHELAWDFPLSVAGAVMSARTRMIGWLRRPRAADRAAVDRALEQARIADLSDRPLGQLSGGQRQRVLVARALATDPRVLLLDEPFTGVDAPTRAQLAELIASMQADGRGVVMTTHDLGAASQVCSRLCLLNRSIVAEGPPSTLGDPAAVLAAFGITGPATTPGGAT